MKTTGTLSPKAMGEEEGEGEDTKMMKVSTGERRVEVAVKDTMVECSYLRMEQVV